MSNNYKVFPQPFQTNFDQEKFAFLELANRGAGLTPINFLYSKIIETDLLVVESIVADSVIATDYVQASNIIISQDSISTVTDAIPGDTGSITMSITNGNGAITLQTNFESSDNSGGDINLQTYNSGATDLTIPGSISLNTYGGGDNGAGNINITPNAVGPTNSQQLGSILLAQNLQIFSGNATKNTGSTPTDPIISGLNSNDIVLLTNKLDTQSNKYGSMFLLANDMMPSTYNDASLYLGDNLYIQATVSNTVSINASIDDTTIKILPKGNSALTYIGPALTIDNNTSSATINVNGGALTISTSSDDVTISPNSKQTIINDNLTTNGNIIATGTITFGGV